MDNPCWSLLAVVNLCNKFLLPWSTHAIYSLYYYYDQSIQFNIENMAATAILYDIVTNIYVQTNKKLQLTLNMLKQNTYIMNEKKKIPSK